ncbi:MAG: chemotaxis protein CheX [Spirochaetaceae bacterium]|jgi:chemotaxis protein CheX|nr:chemotaxis protein CheX [Spirochaetaceae bacterium]
MVKQYLQPFAIACMQVFKNFVGAELVAERSYLFDQAVITGWDLFAMIGFSGGARGAVVISMKKELAFKLAHRFTGRSYTAMDDDVTDTIGEIVNIIAGNVKRGSIEQLQLRLSPPTIIRGSGHSISWLAGGDPIVSIPFKIYEHEIFMLSVTLEKKGAEHDP